jgi:hypothetical protein
MSKIIFGKTFNSSNIQGESLSFLEKGMFRIEKSQPADAIFG